MEKKTIGQFMAALRRANGMTQKQLAEKLNVSDKSVSRWERDECAPDLTLIPVIAEIFGVTSDDILRGERMNREFAAEREEKKGEKQIKRLLKSTEDRLKMRSIISVGIALLGIIAAMICNFGFLRAYIGFFAGAVFILLSLICELLFGMQAFAAVSDEDICGEAVNESKAILLKIMEAAFSTIVAFLAFMLPLVMIPWDTYMGISAASWFVEGLVLSVITGILSFFVCWFVNSKTADAYNLSGSEKRAAKNEIKKKQVKFAVILIAATAVIQIVFNAAASADVFTEKKIFYTTEEFIEFMETPMDWNGSFYAVDIQEDEYWSEGYIYDKNGNETDSYLEKNESVSMIEYDWKKGDPAYVVYTHDAVSDAYALRHAVKCIFVAVYIAEIVFFAVSGMRKCKNLNV